MQHLALVPQQWGLFPTRWVFHPFTAWLPGIQLAQPHPLPSPMPVKVGRNTQTQLGTLPLPQPESAQGGGKTPP